MRTTVTIYRATNYIRINDYSPEFIQRIINPFCSRFLFKLKKEPIPGTNKSKVVVDKVFARLNNDKSELRISAGLFDEFVSYVESNGYKRKRIKILDEKVLTGKKVKFDWKPPFGVPRPHQVDWCQYQLEEGGLKINNGPTGSGKDQPLYSKIKVPGGWSTMGDMYVGAKVIARDGTVTRVDGVYPQGTKKIYCLTFSDGRTAECGEGHLWKVYDVSKTKTSRKKEVTRAEQDNFRWGVYDTKHLIQRMGLSQPRLYIPLPEPEQNPDKKFHLHPYLLGVILGDGCVATTTPMITKPYQQLFDKVQSLLPDWMECCWKDEMTFSLRRKEGVPQQRNGVTESLRSLDLFQLRSWEKFIPQEYFEGSKEQRLALLQGLLDTDGTVGTKKTVSFSSSSKALAEGVQYLVRSLGGIAKLSTRIPHFTHKGERKEGRTDYRVHIRYPRPEELFTLDHKKERAKPTQYSDILKLRIIKIEEVGFTETQCISVEHDEHLYITDDFVVTHNTYMATDLIVNMGRRTMVTCLPRYVSIWLKALPEYLDLNVEDVVVMENGLLSELADNIEQGVIDPKIIIIPLTRYDRYLKEMRENDAEDLDSVFTRMDVGLRIMDESHESIYQVYMSMLFGNFEKTLALSATLVADDPVQNRVYGYVYPIQARFKEPEQNKYIDVYAYHHNIDLRQFRVKCRGFSGYSHVMFEQSIMRSPFMMQEYYKLVRSAFIDFYLKDKLDKQRCLFFFATVEMCVNMLNRLKKDYPDMDIVKFTNEESSSKELKNSYMEHDVVITTPQSCGTGKDIEYLYTVICPYAASSRQRNAQMLGRLRVITKWWPHLNPKFVYFVCDDIEKQVAYHHKRMEEFKDKSKSITNIASFHRMHKPEV